MSLISAFILSFNHTQKLIECVSSLLQQSCVSEILILDNKSTKDLTETYSIIKGMETSTVSIEVHYLDQGISFSEAQNWGLDQCKNEFVLLMNNDAFFLNPETLHTSVTMLEKNSKIGIVGHKILNLDGTVNHHGVYMNIGNWDATHFGGNRNPSSRRFLKIYSCIAVTGACMLVRRTDIRFDPVYWFGYEDVDFCFQYLKSNYQIVCNPFVSVMHEESSSRKLIQHVDPYWLGRQTIGAQYFRTKWATFKKPLFFKSLRMNFLSSTSNFEYLFRTHADFIAMGILFLILIQLYHFTLKSFGIGFLYLLGWSAIYFALRHLVFYVFEGVILLWMLVFNRNNQWL